MITAINMDLGTSCFMVRLLVIRYAGGTVPCSMKRLPGGLGLVDDLGRAVLYASLKVKHTVAEAGPASSHQHCGRDIHKCQDDHQDHHEMGKLLRLSTAIPGPVDSEVKVGRKHRAVPQRNSTHVSRMMRLQR
jgi:hypothetical protein